MSRGTRPNAHPNRSSSAHLMRLLHLYLKTDRVSHTAGFTLVELLVALIVSTIMVTILLGSAVQLMGTNQREAARSDTQRDVQAALDYMARDMREAVYVYDGECLLTTSMNKLISPAVAGPPAVAEDRCNGILQRLPAQLNEANNLPVLAFWRVDPLPEPLIEKGGICRKAPTAAADGVPCASRSMYTLVVYSVNNANPDRTWAGRSRITRYQLPQFTYSGGTTITKGWVSPVAESSFVTWPRASAILSRGEVSATADDVKAKKAPSGGPATDWDNKVLVDFVDDQSIPPKDNAEVEKLCPNPLRPPAGTSEAARFIVTPAQNETYKSTIPKTVFYACVRGAGGGTLNQEVLLRIRANGAGRGGVPLNRDLPLTMETRVLTRGVLGKS